MRETLRRYLIGNNQHPPIYANIVKPSDDEWGTYSDLSGHYRSNAELLREAMKALQAERRNKERT